MSGLPRVILSANGTTSQPKAERKYKSSQALVSTSSLTGIDAVPALHGNNGETVNLEFIPSREGGFSVRGSIGKITSTTHVGVGYDLFVDARGSDGEDGGRGGDGLPGRQGPDGKDATRESDALPGGNGGRGGDGGFGSSGGNGGDGGNVSVLTSEQNMHLIIALNWDVRGGKGGKAGKHGLPGPGGSGGRGGSGHTWQELTGYECQCFPHGTRSVSAPIMRSRPELTAGNLKALSQLQPGRDLAFSFPQGYITDGINVARVDNLRGKIPTNIAPQFERALLGAGSDEEFSNAVVPRGLSAMTGDHASDCQQMPTYTTRHKAGAPDGIQGPSGRSPATPLKSGQDGLDGTIGIQVRYNDGSVSTYDSKFEFQLLGFDIVDENGDGVFEPGECLIIKNIRIKNSGGMPTPKDTLIPVTMQPSTWIKPLPGKDTVYMPFDIPTGGTKRIANEIWAKIKSPSTQPDGTAFKATSTVKLQAIVPDLNRKLPHFEPSQTISIQYPVRFVIDEFKWMDTISQGSSTSLQWAIMNISSKDLGINSDSRRTVATRISCPTSAPVVLGDTLSSDSLSDQCCRMQEIDFLRRQMSSSVSEGLLVPRNTPEYSTVDFLIELLLTPAPVGPSRKSPNPIILQTHRLSMQVSQTWQYNASSEFLLLTSKSTTKDTIISWSHFIQKHLHKSVDVWNVSLYGGVEAEATYQSVLDSYVGKTILALDDDLFSYLDRGQRSILDFIDPLEGSLLSRKGTRIVSVHKKAKERHEREEKNMEHVAHAAALRSSQNANDELQAYGNTGELIDRLRKLREDPSTSSTSQQFFIPFNGSSPHSKGREIAKKLTKEFPLDQFLVTDSSDGLGVRIVHCGAHGQRYSTAEVAQTSNGVGRVEEFSGLNPAEAYACVAALPLNVRLDILLTSQQATGSVQYSDFIQNAALSSVKAELHDQVQAMAKRPRWRDGLFPDAETVKTKSLFDSTNDNITIVLNHEIMVNAGASVDDPTSPAGQILRSIIQSARCQTTEQLLIKWLSPFKRTRSHVRRSLMGSVSNVIASNGPNNEPNPTASQDRIKYFKKTVPQKLLNKNYQVGINSGVQAITHDAIRDVKQSLTTIEEVMPQSVYKSPNELSTKKSSYEKAELQRKRDRMQHRLWKKELGRDITSSTASVKSDGTVDVEAGSSMYSTELASTSVYGRGIASSLSETSTIPTLPEMDDAAASPTRKPPGPPPVKVEVKNNKDRSMSPQSPVTPLFPSSRKPSAELPSTSVPNRRAVSTPNRPCPPIIPSPESAMTPSSLPIKTTRERPQLETKYTCPLQALSPQSIPIPVSPSSRPSHNHSPASASGVISPGFSLPELLDEDDSWTPNGMVDEPPHTPPPQRHESSAHSPGPVHEDAIDAAASDENASILRVDEGLAEHEGLPEPEDAIPYANANTEPAVTDSLRDVDDGDDTVDEFPVWSDYDEDDLKINWTG